MFLAHKTVALFLLFTIPFTASCLGTIDISFNKSTEGLDIVEEAWKTIQRDFVDSEDIDLNELAEEAIQAMVETLDDPHTSYLTREQYQLSNSRFRGEFSGIGATVTIKNDQLTVVAPIVGSPADKAGIKPDDVVLAVDGQLTADFSLQENILLIRGPKGTSVILSILHSGEEIPVEITIIRADIELPSVTWEFIENDRLALIKITNFSDRTSEELTSALNEIILTKIGGVILDFRYNPGGILDAAVDVASHFLEEGTILYSLNNAGDRVDWDVQTNKGIALDAPLVILVNGHSASASEVVSGALQDYNRAVLIGTTTFGKGSMNLVRPLSNGGALYITNARWFTPNGRQIEKKGITPDIVVEPSPEDSENDRDLQLDRAISHLSN